ncbi:MAG: beta-ketoacyl synthase N-terminal-like domain-containing protein [Lentisphaerota bacterium]
MNISGMGILFSRGRGVPALEQALEQGLAPPSRVALNQRTMPVYSVTAESMTDKLVLSKARRADRLSRMAVLAAADALQDSGLSTTIDKSRLGVILATALGPHSTTFNFLDGILEFGDAAASPTVFSHSVHNAAASYVAMTLDIRGPTLTVTHFHFAFHQAVLLAQMWLQEKRCDAVLVGVSEELGAVMEYACSQMLHPAADGRIKPFAFSSTPETVPGEGSAFFLCTPDSAAAAYGRIAVHASPPPLQNSQHTLHILEACGMAKDETLYRKALAPDMLTAGYAPLFGSLLTGSAFHAATAACMLKRQKQYASPVLDNPWGVTLCSTTTSHPWTDVLCTQLDCHGAQAILHLTR